MTKHINDIEYELIDPTGNITALVRTAVDESDQPRIAALIMDSDSTCEQVGFIADSEDCEIRLRMAAGEFCGNATMSTAALYCDDNGLQAGDGMSVRVRTSGCADPVKVDITRKESDGNEHIYRGRITMPRPKNIIRHTFTYKGAGYDLPVVVFDGISHVIACRTDIDMPDDEMESVIKEWCEQLQVDGIGIMLTDLADDFAPRLGNDAGHIEISMRPLVYVPAVSSCFWENSCASGTTSVAAYLQDTLKADKMELVVKQRGGALTVCINEGQLILEGTVRI